MTMGLLISGLLISCLGTILIFYAKAMGRILPALVGVAMCVYPLFVYDLWWLWGLTVGLCVLLYLMREKE